MKKYKYKNSIEIKGERHHLASFSKDLERLGYKQGCPMTDQSQIIAINPSKDNNSIIKNGEYAFYVIASPRDKYFTLPDQWSEALKAAAEIEEDFKENDWVVSLVTTASGCFVFGKIYQVRSCNDHDVSIKKDSNGHTDNGGSKNLFRKATEEEIKNHLIEEAKEKGFVVGGKFLSQYASDSKEIKGFALIINDENHTTGSSATASYFRTHGVHLAAEFGESQLLPLGMIRPVPSHPSITINGYEAKFEDWGLNFNDGCAKIDKQTIECISWAIDRGLGQGNKGITSVKIGKGEFTVEQIIKIAEYYANKE